MSAIWKLANQTAIYGLSSIVGRVINFLLVPLYVRVFAPAEYGVSIEFYAYFTFLNILYTYGMETAFFRFVNRSDNPRQVFSTSFFSLLLSTLVFSTVLFALRGPASSSLGYADRSIYLTWMALILAFDTLAVIPFCELRQNERPLKFAVVKILNIGINVFFNLFFLVACPLIVKHGSPGFLLPLVGYVYFPDLGIGYIFISNLIASAATLLLLSKEILRFNLDIDFGLLKKMLAYGAPLAVVGFAGMINDSFDRTILRHLLPYDQYRNEELLGIYGANLKLAVFMMLLIQSFRFAAEPFFFIQAKEGDPKPVYASVMKFFVIAGLLVFLAVTLYIDIFKLLIGARGSRYYEGLGVVPILLISYLVLGIYYNLSIWYKLQDKTGLGAFIAVVGAVSTIVLNVALIPRWGFYACAVAKLATFVLMVAVSYAFAQKYYPVRYPLGRIGFYFLLALAIYFADLAVKTHITHGAAIPSLIAGTLFLSLFLLVAVRIERGSISLGDFFRKCLTGRAAAPEKVEDGL